MDALDLPRLSSGSGRRMWCVCVLRLLKCSTCVDLHVCFWAWLCVREINVSDPSEQETEYSKALFIRATAFKSMGYTVHQYIYYVCVMNPALCMPAAL